MMTGEQYLVSDEYSMESREWLEAGSELDEGRRKRRDHHAS